MKNKELPDSDEIIRDQSEETKASKDEANDQQQPASTDIDISKDDHPAIDKQPEAGEASVPEHESPGYPGKENNQEGESHEKSLASPDHETDGETEDAASIVVASDDAIVMPSKGFPGTEKPAQEAEDPQEDSKHEDDMDVLAERYESMDPSSLVETLEGIVQEENISHIRRHIGFIKASFRRQMRLKNMEHYEQQIAKEKGEEMAEEVVADPLTERFDAAFAIYKKKKAAFDKEQDKLMQLNLEAKEAILEDLRQLIESEEELKKTYDQFNALQESWRNVGPVPRGSKNTLWNNYHFLVEKFFDKVNINKELKDLDLKKNLELKTSLCEKAEELILEASVTKTFLQLQKFHEAWKETGPVPKDKKDEIWDRFKAATDKLNKRRQEHYDHLKEEQEKNYAAKLVLCEKAEELTAQMPETPKQWQKKTQEVNDLFKVWKSIGFAPKKVNNEIWSRFRSLLDSFFSAKKDFFRDYKDQQKENYNQKLNLCLQAEALKDSEDWKSTTEALIKLQGEWKAIGPVPAKFSDKIWKRFRQACDHFFHRKSEFFSNVGEKQEENLQMKLALIEEVKSFKYADNNVENLNTLKGFQRQWMGIGHVPMKMKEKVQSAFRKAIDDQFELLNISKKEKSTLSFKTKIDNLKSSPHADNVIQKERNYIAGKIKNLESNIQVLENNIGFFASSKKADVLKAEVEERIEKTRGEISVLKEKMRILRQEGA